MTLRSSEEIMFRNLLHLAPHVPATVLAGGLVGTTA